MAIELKTTWLTKVKRLNRFIPNWVKNKYFLTFLFFIVWLTFVDNESFIMQYSLYQQQKELTQRKKRLQKQIKSVQKEINTYKTNPSLLEKYARENYLMKRDNETIFIYYENKK